jgi:hypothetical protein
VDINKVLNRLEAKGLISKDSVSFRTLTGGSSSKVYLINEKYVVKINEELVIKAESNFLQTYQHLSILPSFVDHFAEDGFVVYKFIHGDATYKLTNKREMLITLVQQLFNHYQPTENKGKWGWTWETTSSWEEFLLSRVVDASDLLKDKLPKSELDYIATLVNKTNSSKVPYLIHGDCGVHNFIFQEQKLCGVIDPTPIYGEPMYDLLFAFCSSPDDLLKETIEAAVSQLTLAKASGDTLYEKVLIVLFLRLATCLRHHPNDFNDYLIAWKYWLKLAQLERKLK